MSDATRLRADGRPITLADGETVMVRFDFDALCEIEEMFGSLPVFVGALELGSKGPIMTTVARGIAAGLRHLPEPPSVNEVRRRLDSRQANDYIVALDEAFGDGMPERKPAEGKDSGETTDSPGTTSTTSEPSDSVAATVSSGE